MLTNCSWIMTLDFYSLMDPLRFTICWMGSTLIIIHDEGDSIVVNKLVKRYSKRPSNGAKTATIIASLDVELSTTLSQTQRSKPT